MQKRITRPLSLVFSYYSLLTHWWHRAGCDFTLARFFLLPIFRERITFLNRAVITTPDLSFAGEGDTGYGSRHVVTPQKFSGNRNYFPSSCTHRWWESTARLFISICPPFRNRKPLQQKQKKKTRKNVTGKERRSAKHPMAGLLDMAQLLGKIQTA